MRQLFSENLAAAHASSGALAYHAAGMRGTLDALSYAVRARYTHMKNPQTPWRGQQGRFAMTSLFGDIRFALRTLTRQPVYTLTIVGMLTLGIAGNTTIFSIFNGLFLRPLPFDDPGQLVNVDETAPRWDLEFVSVNYADFDAWRENNQSFQEIGVFDDASFAVTHR